MKTFIIGIASLFLSLIAVANDPIEFESAYKSLREKKDLLQESFDAINSLYTNNNLSIENRLISQILATAILSSQDINELTKQSISICDTIIEKYPDTWQSDFLQYVRLTNYGLLGEYIQQISLAKDALRRIKFDRFDTKENTFLNIYRETYGISGEKLRDEIKRILGYAYFMSGKYDLSIIEYNSISNSVLRSELLKQAELLKEKHHKPREILQSKPQ